jgi:hypothetical protein
MGYGLYKVKRGAFIQQSPSLLSHSVPQVPMHNPSASVPLKHDVLLTQVKPDTGVFVQDVPEGSAAEQSPTVSALARSSDASQGIHTISTTRNEGGKERN